MPRTGIPQRLVDFLLIFAGFALAIFPYTALFQSGLTVWQELSASGISAVTFWVAIQFQDSSGMGPGEGLVPVLEQFCLGTGANLLLHSVLTYTLFIRRTPFLIAIGGLFAAMLLSLRRARVSSQAPHARVLLIGFDDITRRFAALLPQPLLGLIAGDDAAAHANIPLLGNIGDCAKILEEYRPTHIVIGMNDWESRISPSALLSWRLTGMVLEEAPTVYERLLHRVSCERLQPMDLLLSSALRGDSRTMAIQSVYTNLIGLFFLVGLSPLLLLVSLAIALSPGPGPVLESVECAGFRYIPFRLLRFRTRRKDGNGEMTRLGRLLARFHLVDLPQLINVVRGEMALVGPNPVRKEFAHYLTGMMPFYSHRFSVKPGILSWAQLHLPDRGMPENECLRVEYDLYYIKRGSPWLDWRILYTVLRGTAVSPVNMPAEPGGTKLSPC